MKFRKVVEAFLSFVEESDRTENTLRHYTGRLQGVRKSLDDRHIEELTLEEVEEALAKANRFKDGSLKAPDTRRANAVVLQCVFTFAVRRKYLKRPLFDKLERPRTRRRERIPTEEENAAIEKLAKPDFLIVFRALRQTGARPGELASVRVEDYDRESGLLVIANHKTAKKTGRPRKIGVGAKLKPLILEAVGARTAGPIFLNRRGDPWTTQKLSAIFRRLRKQAGLPREIVLYSQRHYHATKMCEKAGIHAAAQALGHSSVQTTQRYIHPDDSQLAVNQDLV